MFCACWVSKAGRNWTRESQDRLLTTQEILILEKAFLQTFAKRESLGRVYGRDKDAGLMMDLHVPQIRREALALLAQAAADRAGASGRCHPGAERRRDAAKQPGETADRALRASPA